ncbi:ATP-binding protein [Candidatus Woesearchaeota archaeon]|nr:ATP-binding protein [Candidatus Woesearchaeota archaeon]
MVVIITRNTEIQKLLKAKNWLLVYGRRKTGKSFLVENFTKWDHYFFVKSGGEIFDKVAKKDIDYSSLIVLLEELIKTNKLVVIDEFHRLPKDFLDFLHINSGKGRFILVSSTLWLSKRLLEKDSPVLGLFGELLIDIISEEDILKFLSNKFSPEDAVVLGTYLREPLMLKYLDLPIKEIIKSYFEGTKLLVPLLISSVFQEEDRKFTGIYEGIVRAIAAGKNNSNEITNFLFSRKLIPKEEHGYAQQYLTNLIKLGLVKQIKLFNSRKIIYTNSSPMIDAYFYLDEKYNFSEDVIEERQLEQILDVLKPKHVEDFISSFLAKKWAFSRNKIISGQLEIDFALTKFQKLMVVGEIKWKNKITNSEIYEIQEKLKKYDCRKVLVVRSRKSLGTIPESIEILTAEDLIKMAKQN